MKLIRSLVRPHKLDEIQEALSAIHVHGLNVVQANDYSPQDHGTTVWLGHEYRLACSVKLQLDVVVQDDDVDNVIGAIMKVARTCREGDGHVMVLPVEHRYDISSGRRDVA